MENTLEYKAKFFALYWGQEVLKEDYCDFIFPVDKDFMTELKIEISSLHLKPLSSISDEDAVGCGHPDSGDFIASWNVSDNISDFVISDADYLRSKGYALPFMGVNVETLVSWGWIKLENNQKGQTLN